MQPPPDYARAGGDQPNFLVINILDGRGFVAHTESGVELAKPPNPMVEVQLDRTLHELCAARQQARSISAISA